MKTLAQLTIATTLILALFMTGALAADSPRVYVEAPETVDAGNSDNKAKQIDFGIAIAAALVKKKVPVIIVTDLNKSQWTIKAISSQRERHNRNESGQDRFSGAIRREFHKV